MPQTNKHAPMNWAVVIFACRESIETLAQTIRAVLASAPSAAVVDVMVNGNSKLVTECAALIEQLAVHSRDSAVRLWSIPTGDKANVWNQYIQQIWDNEELVFFIDGYVRLNLDAVTLLGEEVTSRTDVLGGTGVPGAGRSGLALRAYMLKHGGFHGNFCCIKGSVISQMKQRRIALPFGLYRVDSLMGALLSFGLHPELNEWNPKRIFVHPNASWQTEPKHWWRFSDARAKLKQVLRQSRGALENLAVKDHFVGRRQLPETLPSTASELVLEWVDRHSGQVRAMALRNPFVLGALAHSKNTSGVPSGDLVPQLVKSSQVP